MTAMLEIASPAQKRQKFDSFLLRHVPGLTATDLNPGDPVRAKIKWHKGFIGLTGDHGEKQGQSGGLPLEVYLILIALCGIGMVAGLLTGKIKLSTGPNGTGQESTSTPINLPTPTLPPENFIPPFLPTPTYLPPPTASIATNASPPSNESAPALGCVTITEEIWGTSLMSLAKQLGPDKNSFENGYAYSVNGGPVYNPITHKGEGRILLGFGRKGDTICQVTDTTSKKTNLASGRPIKGWADSRAKVVYISRQRGFNG